MAGTAERVRGRAARASQTRYLSRLDLGSLASAVAIPGLFVLLWASGFVVPRTFGPYVEPLAFIAARNPS